MSILSSFIEVVKNLTMNSVGIERDMMQLIQDKDIGQVKTLFQDRDYEVSEVINEYNPESHAIMERPDKFRKGKEPYKVQKLPRAWQKYVNEIALFFLLAKPIKWTCTNLDDNNKAAFEAFTDFLKTINFDSRMRHAKRLAGAETECAKLYHIYKNEEAFKPEVKVIVLAKSENYTLRPLFDQYKNLLAFGYGYFLKEGKNTVEHFDIHTPKVIYNCKKLKMGWEVMPVPNPTGKINIIYYKQPKEWEGADIRIARDEMVDSKAADVNEYFADPVAKASADVIKSMVDPETVGKLVQMAGKDSIFEYVEPPTATEMKDSEKRVLKESILNDTFTPDFSNEAMKGTGDMSGEALKRAMILGFMKRDNRKEIYEEMVNREKNLILSIMANITHAGIKTQLESLNIEHEFAEPFSEDKDKQWTMIGRAYVDGIMSLETAVMLLNAANPTDEIERIAAAKMESLAEPTI